MSLSLTSKKTASKKIAFSENLLRHYADVDTQAKKGIDSLNRSASFFTKIARMELKYSKKMQKLVDIERAHAQSTRTPSKDMMNSFANAQDNILKNFENISLNHKSLAETVDTNIAKSLENCHKLHHDVYKEVCKKSKLATEKMNNSLNIVSQSKSRALRVIEGDDATITRSQEVAARLSDFKRKLKGKEKMTEEEACCRYQDDIDNANIVLKKYQFCEMPSRLSELQILEEKRIKNFKSFLEKLPFFMKNVLNSYNVTIENIQNGIKEINYETDISDFVDEIVEIRGSSKPIKLLEYDLPCSVGSKLKRKSSQQGSSLEEIMKRPENKNCEIPKLVSVFTNYIEELGGFELEGIFRVSAEINVLNKIKIQVIEGNYQFENNLNAHVFACLLKDFLRSLKYPLIPYHLYQQSLNFGIRDDDKKFSEKEFKEFIAKIPEINQRVILHMCKFLNKIIKKEDINLMGLENIAIVFAPSFIRNPSTNPMEALENTKLEIGIVIQFLKFFKTDSTISKNRKAIPSYLNPIPDDVQISKDSIQC